MSRHHNEPVVLLPGPDRFASDALRAANERPPASTAASPLTLDELRTSLLQHPDDPHRAAVLRAVDEAIADPTPDPAGMLAALDTMNRHAETHGLCDGTDASLWRDFPDTDGLWWTWAGEGHDPEPVRVVTERENARDPRRKYLYIERLGHEGMTHHDDVRERYGVTSLRWCPLTTPEPPR